MSEDNSASKPKMKWKQIIIESVGDGHPVMRIYTAGIMTEDGNVTQLGDETFGSLPHQPHDVLKVDGTLVSYNAYCAELDGEL